MSWAHPRRCLSRQPLGKGEIARVPASACVPTRAIGYYLGCPSCGARNAWICLDDDTAVIVEGAPVKDEGEAWGVMAPFYRPSTIATERREPCRSCGAVIGVQGGELVTAAGEATPPSSRAAR